MLLTMLKKYNTPYAYFIRYGILFANSQWRNLPHILNRSSFEKTGP